jgi:sec-independent protein translocase protein TatC
VDDREYTLIEHLTELRTRVVRAAIGVVLVSFVAFAAAEEIIHLLRLPLERALVDVAGGKASFVVISPAEYFISQLKAALVAGMFISSPWALYQLWLFIAPGLYKHEQRWASGFVIAGATFFVGGGLFAYFFAFPGMFRFFLASTVSANINMTLSIAEHLSFSMKLLLAFGVAFQTPVIVFVLSMMGILDPKTLTKYRSYVVVGAFILSAILTPPDILSQTLLAIPLILLFELGVFVSRVVLKFRTPPLSRDARAAVDAANATSNIDDESAPTA